MATFDSHSSVENQVLDREAIRSLQSNRIDPKFLYLTPRQAELWRQVSLKHSPIHANPEFTRIYREAFMTMTRRIDAKKIFLAGLGCGTGQKEADLCSSLKASGRDVLFSAVDVSRDLVSESAQRLVMAGADHRRSLACDLTQAEFLGPWLDDASGDLPRLMTFFGLFPNFAPSVVARLFHAILRPGDILLASAHLVPVQNESRDELSVAMQSVLPQYANPETLAWLTAALQLWNLEDLVHPPEMAIGEIEGIPAFTASSAWKTCEPFEKWGHRFLPNPAEPLRLFFSLRYTPALFEELLAREGFHAEQLSITSCRQEGLWCIRCA